MESVIINSSTTEVSSNYTVTFDNLGTDYGLYDANTAVGSGEVMLTSSGLYVLATVLDTSFLGIPSGGVEDASTRIVDWDGGGDTEFRISNDVDAWGISEEVNIQSAFDFGFEVVSFTIEDLDDGEQVLLSLVQDDPVGGDYNDPTVWVYDITALDTDDDGVFTAGELAADANLDLTDVDQFILETNDGSTIYLDNLVIA